jgi:hypothetical protein
VSVVEAMKVSVEAVRVPIKAVRVAIVIVGSPKRLREYKTLSRPQQHSHSREKVPVNSLLQAKRVLVDCRGLESALEAVRVSVEAVRVSVETVRVSMEALRCLRGCERLEEVPENVS